MDGGCLTIWRKEQLSVSEKNKLQKYAVGINRRSAAFSIQIENPEPISPDLKEQVIKVFDGLPREEITICGLADFLFMATEEILNNFGGYLKVGLGETREAILAIEGETIELFDRKRFSHPNENTGLFLVDYLFVMNYFNGNLDPEIRNICNLDTYL